MRTLIFAYLKQVYFYQDQFFVKQPFQLKKILEKLLPEKRNNVI